jgi:hypothetical protein
VLVAPIRSRQRAMAYVGMTRGRDENHLAIYPAVANEAHQHHVVDTGIH